MLVTNLTADTFVLSSRIVLRPNAIDVIVTTAEYQADSELNRQIDHLEEIGSISTTGKPATDPFPTVSSGWNRITTILETDPDTFVSPLWEYDFGGVASVFLSARLLTLATDGEVAGAGMGKIAVSVGERQGQRDDDPAVPGWTTFTANWSVENLNADDYLSSVGHYVAWAYVVPQCLRLTPFGISIKQNGSDDLYAGSNNPVATVELVVEWK